MIDIPRRLADQETSNAEQSAHDTLHQQRDSPSPVIVDICTKVIDPDTGSITDDVARELYTSEFTAVVWRRDLGLVDWHNCRQSSDSETSNDSPEEHHWHASSKGLESTADNEDQ